MSLTVGKALAALERDGRVRRTPGGHDPDGRRQPDRWTTPPSSVAEADGDDPKLDVPQLRKGQLRALVLEQLHGDASVSTDAPRRAQPGTAHTVMATLPLVWWPSMWATACAARSSG